jgi:hypothetical protein
MARIVTEAAETLNIESAGKVCYADEMAADYAGYLSPTELAAELAPLATALPPEQMPLMDFLLWRLGSAERIPAAATISAADAALRLKELQPRVKDDSQHAALLALTAALAAAL